MKILAFSDWRIQSLEMIKEVIDRENPDLILYAGDDVKRILSLKRDKVYFKTHNNFIECELKNSERFLQHEGVRANLVWPELLQKITNFENESINNLDIPLVYVIGNDDLVVERDEELFLHVSRGVLIENDIYYIFENQLGQLDLISLQGFQELSSNRKYLKKALNEQREFKIVSIKMKKALVKEGIHVYKCNRIYYTKELESFREEPFLNYIKGNGIYIKITPDFGKQTRNINQDSITIFGSSCSMGRESKIIKPPTEHADIFLSHIPPLGKLDLSKRFGIEHIGSEEFLLAVQEYKPKIVICGHSHIWGGMEEKIGETVVLNVSSQDNPSYENEGNFALINTKNWSYQIFLERDMNRGLISIPEVRGGRWLVKKLRKKSLISLEWEQYEKLKSEGKKLYDYFRPFISIRDGKPCIDLSGLNSPEDFKPISKKYLEIELSIDLDDFFQTMKDADALSNAIYEKRNFKETYEFLDRLEEIGIESLTYRNRINSIKKGIPNIKRSITLDPEEYWFVDVETGLASGGEPGKLWLIGIGDGETEEVTQFRYPEEEEQFFQFIKVNDIIILVSWTNYDSKVLLPILNSRNIKIKFYDACARVANAIECFTHKLHELYDLLFPDEKTPEELIPGRIAGLYADHLIFDESACPYCSDRKEKILGEIIIRNKLDIIQTIRLCKKLYNEDEFRCPNCGKKFKSLSGQNQHVKNKVCGQPK